MKTITQKIVRLQHARQILGWDEATMMPRGGSEARAESLAELDGTIHQQMTREDWPEVFEKTRKLATDVKSRAALREMERLYRNATALPQEFVERQTRISIRSEHLWRDLRPKNDWKGFLPTLKEVVATAKEAADLLSQKLGASPYQCLMDTYSPGVTVELVQKLFGELKSFLPDLIQQATRSKTQKAFTKVSGQFPKAKQRELALKLMELVGFDFNHGRLDESTHPFCGGAPSDVRITTRYNEQDFVGSLYSVIHEAGHGLYEMHLPREIEYWPSIEARGMAAHESQSLLFELQVGRSREFVGLIAPLIVELFAETSNVKSLSLDDLYENITPVGPSLIRVEADEVTYPMHVILRYEIERALIEDKLTVEEIPSLWDQKMKSYLGLSTLGDDRNGCMQDVHWPAGIFGYFPAYALGAIMASQLYAKAKADHPNLSSDVAKGNLSPLKGWLDRNVWKVASTCTFDELLMNATGRTLGTEAFKQHLESRYLKS